jgi:hypothetical protein
VVVNLDTFFHDVEARMKASGISKGKLALRLDKNRSQITRWFRTQSCTLDSARMIVRTIEAIEQEKIAA